jgi:DNA (cytosine-5)-methyltransferase 1
MKKLNVIDIFAGCGGLAEGFLKTGSYNTLATVDWDKSAVDNIRNRFKTKWEYENAEEINLHFDIQRVDELFEGYKSVEYGTSAGLDSLVGESNVDIIIGGPPCQAYSIAGRIRDRNGMHDDYRNYLFESYVKVVDHYKPQLFVFENVQGILSAKPGGIKITDRIRADFKAIGYSIYENLNAAMVNTADFGVPQIRKRLIIVGLKDTEFDKPQENLSNFYTNILAQFKEPLHTVNDAIKDLQKIYPTQEFRYQGKKYSHQIIKDTSIANHIPRYHSQRDQNIFSELAVDFKSGRKKYPDANSLIRLYEERTGRTTSVHKYHVLEWDKPSNTIPAHLYKDGLRHIHPDPKQARSITVREAARIQTFDDDYTFIGSMGNQYKMIGNAVPPKLAKHVGNAIYQFLSERN